MVEVVVAGAMVEVLVVEVVIEVAILEAVEQERKWCVFLDGLKFSLRYISDLLFDNFVEH